MSTKIKNKKVKIGIGALILALMLTVGVSVAVAADHSSNSDSFISRCGQTIQKGYGMMSDVIADLLGMSREEVQAERESGKSIAEIAQEEGVDEQALIDGMLEAKEQHFQEAVENGYLAQDQADQRMEWMEEKMERKIENGGGRFGHEGHKDRKDYKGRGGGYHRQ